MVRGLSRFREHFRAFSDRYVLIGGTACDLLMEEAGLSFRATADLDIVLRIEVLDPSFIGAFWDFIEEGGYHTRQHTSGSPRLYRFSNPEREEYPAMLELLSRAPDGMTLSEDAHLTPIPADDPLSSLSAIVLERPYYDFLHLGIREIDGLPIVDTEHLIPLKARAFMNLFDQKARGAGVQSRDIRKHRNDVFRLYRLLSPDTILEIPPEIREDMDTFLDTMATEEINLGALGIRDVSLESILDELRRIYGNV